MPHLKDKSIKRNFSPIYVTPELGLMALVETRYKFMNFGKSQHACVYRIDDLIGYDMETDTKTVDGKQQTEYFVRYSFRGTDGMTSFRVKYESASSCGAVAKYFNELFGIQKTLGNAMNNWSRQKDAISSIVSAVSAASNGDEDAEDRVGAAMDALDSAVYGDRSELKTRAEAALSAYDA